MNQWQQSIKSNLKYQETKEQVANSRSLQRQQSDEQVVTNRGTQH